MVDPPVSFPEEAVKSIIDSLPSPESEHCLRLLPRILDEWCRIDLREHWSREGPAARRKRFENIKRIQKRAQHLLEELKAINDRQLASAMLVADGLAWPNVDRADFENRVARVKEQRVFLSKLAATSPPTYLKSGAGQPRNLTAYLVLQDAAAIFEWFTGTKAARGVDRIDGSETGPFFRFVSILWPLIFSKKRAGLPAALKNWALARSRFSERSALIINMHLRHPTWGIFDR